MKNDKYGRETVPCKWCGNDTASLGTKMCDRCWELEHRISADPVIAWRIFESLDSEAKEQAKRERETT